MATVGGVDIEIRGDNVHFLRELRQSERQAGATGQRITREFKQADTSVRALNTSMAGLRGTITGVVSVLASGAMASAIVQAADAFSTMRSRIALSITAADDLLAVEKQLYDQAVANRAALEPTVQLYQRLRGAVEGLTNEQTLAVTDAWSKTLVISGASAQGAASSTLQFAQAIAGGVLRAEEFNSIIESNTRFVQALAASLGVSVGEVRRLVNEGVITTDVIFKALNDNASEFANEYKKIPLTVSSAFVNVGNAFTSYIGLSDQASGTSAKLAGFINSVANDFDRLADIVVVAVATVGGAVAGLAAARVVGALAALSTQAGIATTALVRLRAAVAFFGGPVGLAVTAIAGTFAYLAVTSKDAGERIADVNDTIQRFNQTQSDIKADTDLLTAAQEKLADAIESQGDAAAAAATLEVDAIQRRITKNQELAKVYDSLARSQLAQARAATAQAERGLARDLDIQLSGGIAGPASGDVLQNQITRYIEWAARAQETGRQLNNFERGLLEQITTLREYELQVAAAQESIDALGQVTAPVAATGGAFSSGARAPTDKEREAAERRAEQRRVAEAQYEIDQARLQGNETLARHLEEQLQISQLTANLMEFMSDEETALDMAIASVVGKRKQETAELQRQADLERQKREDAAALAIDQAQADRALILARAKGDEDEIRALEEILDFRRRVAEYESKGLSAADAIDQAEADIRAVNALRQSEMRQAIADEIAAGLTEGIRTGDWGTVFKGILAKSTTDALSDAINDLASILTDLFSSAIKGLGGSAGSSIGASIASLFGGGRAGGGSVAAGMRYIVGEQGPEMFVPSVPGTIVPQFEGPASAAANGVMGIQSMTITAPFIVQGSITEEVFPRVQAMMAAQARELPRIIDARVTDSLRRNRY